jgi:hypothetical protein
MSPALKNGLLLALVVVVLGGGWFVYSKRTKPDDTSDPGTVTHWMCDKCGKHIDLTFKLYDEWRNSTDKIRRDPKYKGRQVVFLCPDCKTYTVVGANVDPATSKWSIAIDSEGKPVAQPTPPGEAPPPPAGG